MLDISDIERHLTGGLMERHYRQRAAAGLRALTAELTAELKQTRAHGDVTEATREGYTAYVFEPGDDGTAELAEAVDAVEAKNPGESATAEGQPDGDVGLVLTSPTSYQDELEEEGKAVLGPTLAANLDRLTRAAAEGR